MGEIKIGDLPELAPDAVPRLLRRASEERWTRLALIGPNQLGQTDDIFTGSAWRLKTLDERTINLLSNLTSLCMLGLPGHRLESEAIEPIAELPRLTKLDLGVNRIGDMGARVLSRLSNLTDLRLVSNGISDVGTQALTSLKNLSVLHLSGNLLTDGGVSALAEMTTLSSLSLGSNPIGPVGVRALACLTRLSALDLTNVPLGEVGTRPLADLTNLSRLGLHNTRIGDASARILASLTHLSILIAYGNRIGDIGAEALCRLRALEVLYLHGNRIGRPGIEALLDTWAHRPEAPRLCLLDLRNNPGQSDGLPPELFETPDAQAILAAWRRYRAPTTEQRPLNEAKLLVVGNEAVGKTSLIRFLTTGIARDPNERKTPGAQIHERIETAEWHPEGSPVTLNVWDFGGQEIMHGTHRFFLTERSLYLLLLEARREDSGRTVFDWLKTIRNHGRSSPVLVIVNKCDDGDDNLGLDETAIQRDYPEVVGFLRTSCNDDAPSRRRVTALRHRIVEVIHGDLRLKHVRDRMPRAWLRIKDALAEKAKARKVIETREFADICATGRGPDAVTDPHEQRALMGLLHDLGVVVAHGWKRDGSTRMAGITLLDPNWLTGAIYALLNSPKVRDQKGELGWNQLPELLADDRLYPPERHSYIVDMMQHPDIGMCFELPQAAGRSARFLIPEALPPSEPEYDGIWPDDSLRFRYHYGFLPPNLLPRFIVQSHRNLTPRATRWRTGVVLEVDGCKVLVRANRDTRRVEIAVCGPYFLRRSALSIVRNDLEAVHALNPEVGSEARVPLPDEPTRSVSFDHLLRLEAKYHTNHRFDPEGATRSYSVGELLAGVRKKPPSPPPLPPSMPEPRSARRSWLPLAVGFAVALGLGVWFGW